MQIGKPWAADSREFVPPVISVPDGFPDSRFNRLLKNSVPNFSGTKELEALFEKRCYFQQFQYEVGWRTDKERRRRDFFNSLSRADHATPCGLLGTNGRVCYSERPDPIALVGTNGRVCYSERPDPIALVTPLPLYYSTEPLKNQGKNF